MRVKETPKWEEFDNNADGMTEKQIDRMEKLICMAIFITGVNIGAALVSIVLIVLQLR